MNQRINVGIIHKEKNTEYSGIVEILSDSKNLISNCTYNLHDILDHTQICHGTFSGHYTNLADIINELNTIVNALT